MTNIARRDDAKKLPKIKIHDQMYRVQNGQMVRAGNNGGKALMDEALSGNKTYEGRSIPTAFGMRSRPDRGKLANPFDHLRDASNLAGGHPDIVDKAARLPGKR